VHEPAPELVKETKPKKQPKTKQELMPEKVSKKQPKKVDTPEVKQEIQEIAEPEKVIKDPITHIKFLKIKDEWYTLSKEIEEWNIKHLELKYKRWENKKN
jgi:chromatin segregation and condensation protein Rec8/ScpA/Scc1 (kleisin family)